MRGLNGMRRSPRRQRYDGLPPKSQLAMMQDDLDYFDGKLDRLNAKLNWLLGLVAALVLSLVSAILTDALPGTG